MVAPKLMRLLPGVVQKDPDAYLVSDNTERPGQGRGLAGRKPADVFVRCLPKLKTLREDRSKEAA